MAAKTLLALLLLTLRLTQPILWSGNDAQPILLVDLKEVLLTALALGDVVPWLLSYLQLSLSLTQLHICCTYDAIAQLEYVEHMMQ